MVDCTAQKCPSHAADVQPADLGKHIEHIVPVWLVQGNGFRNDFHLVPQSHTGQTGTSSGDLLRRQLLQNGKDRTGSGGVANAHFAGDDQVVAGGDLFSHQCNASDNGTFCLLPCHSRLMGKVAGAGGDLSGNYAVAVQFLRHADVHGKNICPADTGQGID